MPKKAATKKSDSILVDYDVALWFQSQGPRYRSKISSVLRAYMKERAKMPKRAAPKARKPTAGERG